MSFGTNLANLGGGFVGGAAGGASTVLGYDRQKGIDAYNQGAASAQGTYQILQNIISAYQQNKKPPVTTGAGTAGGFFGGGGITYN
jgi:hypothetical protein